ncbi:short-chain oxidoreductase [Amniculicola lignicola CBS 123094]|uniref:Short-chain oxidoreductase n=1 Tax=Amniculicola lignicola CBS 123094 TaxID=1392246 RepID=A0A6A5WBQ9_9PLEO|nr:short-chain oxidoreductase [Amniculicola lignicola CBS 123094]
MPQLTWLVTGCTSGLGKQFIHSILARGDKAIATARGDISRLDVLAKAGAKVYSLDVTASPTDINAIVGTIVEENGQIDIVVPNAGYIEAGISEEVSYEQYLSQFAVNFFGVVKTTQAILPHFRAQKAGTIVFMGSVGGIAGDPGAGPYCSTKHALEGWYECLKIETAPFGIRSIIFELGHFRTKVFNPEHIQIRSSAIEDYTPLRTMVEGFIRGVDGNQPGDPKQAVEVILDVIRGEGAAEGKAFPDRLPLGGDCLVAMRKKAVSNLTVCNEWEDVIRSTDIAK